MIKFRGKVFISYDVETDAKSHTWCFADLISLVTIYQGNTALGKVGLLVYHFHQHPKYEIRMTLGGFKTESGLHRFITIIHDLDISSL